MKKLLSTLAIVLLITFAHAQTNVSGGIFTNTTWTLANSPYIVTDTVVVFPNVTLTIQPGVTVQFNPTKFIQVRGSLKAMGTVSDTIRFTSNAATPAPGDWNGIRIINQADSVNLNYCSFQYAQTAIVQGSGVDGLKICKNSLFAHNKIGIGFTDMNVTVDSCYFKHDSVGIDQVYRIDHSTFIHNDEGISRGYVIANSLFCGNSVYGIGYVFTQLTNCTITNNDVGVFSASATTVTNNYIYRNRIGFQFSLFAGYTITNNYFCSNTDFDFVNQGTYTINAQNNCWCDTVSTNIAAKVYDAFDNINLGVVNYTPVLVCDTSVLPTTTYCSSVLTSTRNDVPSTGYTLQVYPNPLSTYTVVQLSQPVQQATLTLDNCLGQTVSRTTGISGQTITLQRDQLPGGLYLLRISVGNRTIAAEKVIITD